MTAEESIIAARVAAYAEAIAAKDIDRTMAFFAPDVVSFDLEAPLCYAGVAKKRERWCESFTAFATIAYEIRDLVVTTAGELAFVRALNHFQGTMPDGRVTHAWVRWTACWRRNGGEWRIVHDHVSVPADLPHGRARLDLRP